MARMVKSGYRYPQKNGTTLHTRGYLEDHSRTRKWLIANGDRKSAKDPVVGPIPNRPFYDI